MVPAPPASVLGQELLQRVDLGAALERPQATLDFGHELPVRSDCLRLLPSLVLVGADENGGWPAVPGGHDLLIRFHDLVHEAAEICLHVGERQRFHRPLQTGMVTIVTRFYPGAPPPVKPGPRWRRAPAFRPQRRRSAARSRGLPRSATIRRSTSSSA